ncbi:hypothetical protein GR157_36810, partial [Burkholderia sp. 4701]|nr:hypothetical protein [Burkholderia sp. 4701]
MIRRQHLLDQRLGESFKLVSDRLEQVHRGLGEMQAAAGGGCASPAPPSTPRA